jgi:2,4-dienoyl-CoA reductase-like NADH-dependent reductase (Old Yellow Enzyme family)
MVKMNVSDGSAGGLSLAEVSEIATAFVTQARVDVIALSGGMGLRNGLYMLRGDVPLLDMIRAQTNWLTKLALLLFGHFIIPTIPFEERFFRDGALAVLAAIRAATAATGIAARVCLVGGVHSLAAVKASLADGFDLVQCGRALLHDPEIVQRWQTESAPLPSGCIRCNRCIVAPTMQQLPVHCPERRASPL